MKHLQFIGLLSLMLLGCKDKDCIKQPPSYFFAFVDSNSTNILNDTNYNDIRITYSPDYASDSSITSIVVTKSNTYNYVLNVSSLVHFPASDTIYYLFFKGQRLGYFNLNTAYMQSGECDGFAYLSSINSGLKHNVSVNDQNVSIFTLTP